MRKKESTTLKPCLRGLFKVIQRLRKPTNMIRKCQIRKPRGLPAVHSFVKSAMKKSVRDIKLMHRPGVYDIKTKNNVNRGRFHNWAKSFIVINVRLLR